MDVQAESVSETDREAIRALAADYIESWLLGDGGRMGRCLHPALAKRKVVEPADGSLDLHEVPYVDMIESAGSGPKDVATRKYEVTLLDVFPNIASAKVASGPFMDYLHVARFGDRWLIVNVLYEPRQRKDYAPAARPTISHRGGRSPTLRASAPKPPAGRSVRWPA